MGQDSSTYTYYTFDQPLIVYPIGLKLLKDDEFSLKIFKEYDAKTCVLYQDISGTKVSKWLYKIYDNPYITIIVEKMERNKNDKYLLINESIDDTRVSSEVNYIIRRTCILQNIEKINGFEYILDPINFNYDSFMLIKNHLKETNKINSS